MNPLMILIPIFIPIVYGFLVLCFPIRKDRIRNLVSMSVVCLTSILVWLLMFFADRTAVTIYSFTSYFAINFRVDGLSCLFAGMVSVMWPPALLYAFEYMKNEERRNAFFAFYVMTYGITLGIAFAADLVTMYVFFEMLTLVTVPLVSHYGDHGSMYAGRKYAAYLIGGASFAFISVVMATVYSGGGDFVFGGILGPGANRTLMLIVYLFGFFGFGAKAAIFPLFGWLPEASVAPTPVTALLHAVAVVNAGVFAVMRLTCYAYGTDYLSGTWVQITAICASAFTMVFAAAMALKQRQFKRRLAYSTISNLSYMLFGVSLMSAGGFAAGMAHMLFHGVIKLSLFLCAGAFMHVTGKQYLYEINGVGKKMPLTFAFYTLGAMSLTGIPLFCGFVSKWNLLTAAAEEATPWAYAGAACLIAATFLCAVYSLSVSVRAYFPMKGTDRYPAPAKIQEANWKMLVPIGFFAALNLFFGICSGPVMNFLEAIARGIM